MVPGKNRELGISPGYFKATMSNKKRHLADFETCVFLRISPQPLELLMLFASYSSEELLEEEKI